jgi:glycosyltransferase involved in cell wall biosynthesis
MKFVKNKKVALVTHVNPFSKGSGQVQRVFNMVQALSADFDVEIFTMNELISDKKRIQIIKDINPNIKIYYVKSSNASFLFSMIFQFLPFLGFGKKSNWVLPMIFRNLPLNYLNTFDLIIFEYWHLYKLAKKLRNNGKKVICDTHNILLGSYIEWISKKTYLPKFWRQYLIHRYTKFEFETALEIGFDELIAINHEEYKILKDKFPKKTIHYCPMGVKLTSNQYTTEKEYKGDKIVYYGGLGNPKNELDARKVIDLYRNLKLVYHDLTLKIIGSNPSKELLNYIDNDFNIVLTGYVEDLEFCLSDIDLAVIPFNGKYGFRSRLIELMYYNIPIITSSDAIWGMGFTNNKDIMIYSDLDLLESEVKSMIQDKFKLQKIAASAKEKVISEYSFEATYAAFSNKMLLK